MVIDKQKIEDEGDVDKFLQSHTGKTIGSATTMVIDERLISEIEKHGYPRMFII